MFRLNVRCNRIALVGSALLFTAMVAKAQTVTNPTFDSTSSVSTEFGTNYGGQAVTGWTGSGYTFLFLGNNVSGSAVSEYGTLSLYGPSNGVNNGLTGSPAGGNVIGMDGAFEDGSISQTINGLTAGDETSVSFWYAGAQQYGFNGLTTEAFDVSLGDQTIETPFLNDTEQGFTGWNYETLTFTPDASSEVLTFLAQGTPTGEPPFTLLSGVSVTSNTPEPSSLVLLGTGILSVGGMLRRKFAKK